MCRLITAVTCLVFTFVAPGFASANETGTKELSGQWYGVYWAIGQAWNTGRIDANFSEEGGDGTALVYVPSFGILDQTFPLTVVDDRITIGDPTLIGFTGIIDGNTITGESWQSSIQVATWYIERFTPFSPTPGAAPGQDCLDLPEMECYGSPEYCGELVQFDPPEGPGYLDYPGYLETWNDQVYSYLRRDLVQLILYATAKVACKTADWSYGNSAPLGLGDMSEADGSTPGTNIGQPFHPPFTHEDGKDIDTAYYQFFAPDNLLRSVGDSYLDGQNEYHLVGPPYALDRWRTALFVAYLSEHPNLRVVGVDGQIGPVLEGTLDELVAMGWISQQLRDSVPLAYEIVDEGQSWFLFHHHHMHISYRVDVTDAPDSEPTPQATKLAGCYPNPFNPRTTIEFEVDRTSLVHLEVVDLRGRLITTLVSEVTEAGRHTVEWNGRDSAGREMPSGVYLSRLEAGGKAAYGRMTLIR